VNVIYVEDASDIAEEYYLSILHDRVGKGYTVICSREGGVDIETVNKESPDKVVKEPLLPSEVADGLPRERALDIMQRANLPEEAVEQAADLLVALYDAMIDEDATLVEINPLILTEQGRVLALDSKVTLDNNAAFRHDGYDEWDVEGIEPYDEQEAKAKAAGIEYVKLEGDVGILGNGAGLVMASLDVVAQAGGEAANFLDIGGGANAETMAESLQLVLGDERVNSVLINVFGGITQCDLVAKGVLGAMDKLGDVDRKLVVRLDGTNAEEGRTILQEADHPNVVPAATMDEAAEQAVAFAAEHAGS
jgi:succinyl-CoA synthetase beta subunit